MFGRSHATTRYETGPSRDNRFNMIFMADLSRFLVLRPQPDEERFKPEEFEGLLLRLHFAVAPREWHFCNLWMIFWPNKLYHLLRSICKVIASAMLFGSSVGCWGAINKIHPQEKARTNGRD